MSASYETLAKAHLLEKPDSFTEDTEAVSDINSPMVDTKDVKEQRDILEVPRSKDSLLALDQNGKSRLYYAISENNVALVKELLKQYSVQQLSQLEYITLRGVWVQGKSWMQSFDKYTKEMYDLLSSACTQARMNDPTFLDRRFRPLEVTVAKKERGWTDLRVAIEDGDWRAFAKYIEDPDQIIKKDKSGWDALLSAIATGQTLMSYQLIDAGLEMGVIGTQCNASCPMGNNPLAMSVIFDNLNIVNKLLSTCSATLKKSMMISKGYKGQTPLILASTLHNEAILERLIVDSDLEIYLASDLKGCSALYYAIQNGNFPFVKLLLKWFAKEQIENIEKDLNMPIWQYAQSLADRTSFNGEKQGIKRKAAYQAITDILKECSRACRIGKVPLKRKSAQMQSFIAINEIPKIPFGNVLDTAQSLNPLEILENLEDEPAPLLFSNISG